MQTIPFPVSAAAFPLQHGVRELLENALDQALLIANTRGEVLFATRKTRIILQTLFAETSDTVIPNEIRDLVDQGRHQQASDRSSSGKRVKSKSTISSFADPAVCPSCESNIGPLTTAQKPSWPWG